MNCIRSPLIFLVEIIPQIACILSWITELISFPDIWYYGYESWWNCHPQWGLICWRFGKVLNALCPRVLQKFSFPHCMCIIITPVSAKLKRGYTGFTSIRLSVRLSICLWTESCPLCNFHNTSWIHFIFTHLIKQIQKVCWTLANFSNF